MRHRGKGHEMTFMLGMMSGRVRRVGELGSLMQTHVVCVFEYIIDRRFFVTLRDVISMLCAAICLRTIHRLIYPTLLPYLSLHVNYHYHQIFPTQKRPRYMLPLTPPFSSPPHPLNTLHSHSNHPPHTPQTSHSKTHSNHPPAPSNHSTTATRPPHTHTPCPPPADPRKPASARLRSPSPSTGCRGRRRPGGLLGCGCFEGC